ncbi:hypothetical protein COOONC_21448 [Cooperia oncophora]
MYPTITFQVIGDEFLTDPCRLDHECRPEKYVRERGDRAVCERLAKVGDRSVTMGKRARRSSRKSFMNGLRSAQPDEPGWRREWVWHCGRRVSQLAAEDLGAAQLYCVHGVCNQDLDVPLMSCIMEKKTASRCLHSKKAANHAANKVFPNATVEGCAFHLAQAWNHKRNPPFGAPDVYERHSDKDKRVVNWWETLKGSVNFFVHCVQINSTYISAGMVFLPQDLWPEVRALRGPPVPSGDLHDRCQDFLNYLETTWLSGPFKEFVVQVES